MDRKGKGPSPEHRYVCSKQGLLKPQEPTDIVDGDDTHTQTAVTLKRFLDPAAAEAERQIVQLLKESDIPHVPRLLNVYFDEVAERTVLVYPATVAIPLSPPPDLISIAKYVGHIAKLLLAIHTLKLTHNAIALPGLRLDPDTDTLVLMNWDKATFSDTVSPNIPTSAMTATMAASVAASSPSSFTAGDILGLGVVLGRWLEPYLPQVSLRYLGSALVRRTTTTYIQRQLQGKLDAKQQGREPPWHPAIAAGVDLLSRLLEENPSVLISPADILRHTFIVQDADFFTGTDFATYSNVLARVNLRGLSRGSPAQREPIIVVKGREKTI
ncbi:hypothetical protein DFS34DRAFT_654626 [Phlyctochytrium arcticum]|nr:hypothetical protein DFS34DRAFT_654626 [Phlyctochytrium arcticum]